MVLYTENGKTMFNDRLLSCLLNNQHDEVRSIIEDADVKNLVDSSEMTLLHHATNADCHTKTLKYLIKKKQCKVNVLDINGNTPLMNAMRLKNMQTIEFLLQSNADILLCGEDKDNPLKMIFDPEYVDIGNAVYDTFFSKLSREFASDTRQIAKILIDAKCSLPRAMFFKDVLIIEYMLDAGCDINDHDPYDGCTALHNAVNFTDALNLKLLLQRGANILADDTHGGKPSDYYMPGKKNSKSVLAALLHYDTSLSPATVKGYQIAAIVLEEGHSEEVEMILRHGFDLEYSGWNDKEKTLLHVIVKNGNPGVIEKIEGMKFNLQARDILGNTALFDAAYFHNPSSLEFLLKHGANLTDENDAGEMPFIHSLEEWTSYYSESSTVDKLKCVEIFLEYGADILSTDEEGNTIFDISLNVEHFVLIQPIISQLAMMEATGQQISDDIFKKLENNKLYKNFFALCRREIEKLQKTLINETVCLFQFLTESEIKLLGYVRNCESAETLEKIISEMHNSNILFIKRLGIRVQNILNIAKLREKAALIISRMSGCSYQDVIERIILFLDKQSLENLCEV